VINDEVQQIIEKEAAMTALHFANKEEEDKKE
jgi:hypothetical protein